MALGLLDALLSTPGLAANAGGLETLGARYKVSLRAPLRDLKSVL